jgi:hypothetical protein
MSSSHQINRLDFKLCSCCKFADVHLYFLFWGPFQLNLNNCEFENFLLSLNITNCHVQIGILIIVNDTSSYKYLNNRDTFEDNDWSSGIKLAGSKAVVIGRSKIVVSYLFWNVYRNSNYSGRSNLLLAHKWMEGVKDTER